MSTDPHNGAIAELRQQYPALPVARCGQIATHGPHMSDVGPDSPRICPGSDGSNPWRVEPQPVTAPAVRDADGPAAAEPPTGTPGADVVLGRAWLDPHGGVWPDFYRDFAFNIGPCREVLLVPPAAGDVLESAQAVAALTHLGDHRDWRAVARLHQQLRAAVDAMLGDRPEPAGKHAPTGPDNRTNRDSDASLPRSAARPGPEPDSGSGWVDRRAWTRQQWLDDARSIFNSVHGGAADLLNGHIIALFAELHDITEQRDLAIAHDRQPYPTAAAYEAACAALEKHRRRADEAEAETASVRDDIAEYVRDEDIEKLADLALRLLAEDGEQEVEA